FADQPVGAGAQEFATGFDLLKQQKYQEARTAFEAGLQHNPSNAMAHYYLAESCRGLKVWGCAEEHYETSLELDAKSNLAELAQARFRKAKAWRLIEEAKRLMTDDNAPLEKVTQAKDTLEIANTFGLDEEQTAVSEQVQSKINRHGEQAKGAEMFRRLEGKWRFVGGTAVYRATVSSAGALEMYIESPSERQKLVGLQVDTRFIFNLEVRGYPASPDVIDGYRSDIRSNFTNGAELFAQGYRLESFILLGDKNCGVSQGWKPVRMILSYVPPLDTIRLLPLDRVWRTSTCGITLDPMDNTRDEFGTGWLDEMVRVR
ncbi:MAG: hypothetical protein OEN50_20895, partial [Deltaproteobacteria bacterium]|nr:hypothetical protein [Deltaproteobacteria bacterium]